MSPLHSTTSETQQLHEIHEITEFILNVTFHMYAVSERFFGETSRTRATARLGIFITLTL